MSDAARSRESVSNPSRWGRSSTREQRLNEALNRIVLEGRAEIRKVFSDAAADKKPTSDD